MANSLTTAKGTVIEPSLENGIIRIQVDPGTIPPFEWVRGGKMAINMTPKEAMEFVLLILETVTENLEQSVSDLEQSVSTTTAWSPNS